MADPEAVPQSEPRSEDVSEQASSLVSDGISSSGPCIRIVVQRYRHAQLSVDGQIVAVGRRPKASEGVEFPWDNHLLAAAGLLAYVSFAKNATAEKVEQAAKTLLHLPVLTLGAWGDGSGTKSVLQLAAQKAKDASGGKSENLSDISVLIVPQANLTAKVKKLGKSIQYRDQIEKSEGQKLYELFVMTVKRILLEHESICRGEKAVQPPNKPTTPDPSIPPKELFRSGTYMQQPGHEQSYGSFDDRGIPQTMANGDPVTKSARKRLQKVYDAHSKRHEKLMAQQKEVGASTPAYSAPKKTKEERRAPAQVDPSLVQVVGGSFGQRQALELQSDMGPFCHMVEID